MGRLIQSVQVGDWFRREDDPPIEVVAVDLDSETIELQHFDGTVEELDFDSWLEMDFEPTSAPEDYSGAMDMDREDFDFDPETLRMDDWSNPLDQIDHLM